MKLYKTNKGLVIEKDNSHYLIQNENWDTYINDDNLYSKMAKSVEGAPKVDPLTLQLKWQAPIQSQEVWAAGVTYLRSKVGRQEESKDAGGGDFYGRVYEAERPEIFFKATPLRVVGPDDKVKIRRDSTWNVPEPELTLVITSSGKIVGYTIGNDMSSRSIEGENPLYLPQAKTYDASAAIGPCVFVTNDILPSETKIQLQIRRKNATVFNGEVLLSQMKRKLEELVSFQYRECSFPHGSLLMTGTGIVPPSDFTLIPGDEIKITIDSIGTLVNTVA